MAVYTEVGDEDLASFIASYGLGELLSFKGIAEGVENTNYLVHTSTGTYILTLYEKRVEVSDLPFYLGLMEHLAEHFHGAWAMALHGLMTLPFWLALAGVATAYFFYMVKPSIPAAIKAKTGFINRILENKYYFDLFNEKVLAGLYSHLGAFAP